MQNFRHKRPYQNDPRLAKPGIIFRDITSLLANKLVFRRLIDSLVHRYFNVVIDSVVGIDARRFII